MVKAILGSLAMYVDIIALAFGIDRHETVTSTQVSDEFVAQYSYRLK
jgi:hypothetical protein